MSSSPTVRLKVELLKEGLSFGATVRDLSRAELPDPAVRKELYDLWIDRGVVLFRDCETGPEMHVELSQVFGKLDRHAFPEQWVEGHPELINVKYYPDDGNCYEVNGVQRGGFLPWHTDLIYTANLNHGGILRPIQLPEHGGGQTGFLDQIAAYDRLPQRLKDLIDTWHVVYVMDINQEHMRFGRPESHKFIKGAKSMYSVSRREYQFPRVLHPMVYTQEGTGRKVLNVSPWWAMGIYELGGPEGEAILREVIDICVDTDDTYFHEWRMDDMMLWDNWRVLHSSPGIDPADTRVVRRTTISGDYALGRNLDGPVADLPKYDA
jgi:taurine dioxygenase